MIPHTLSTSRRVPSYDPMSLDRVFGLARLSLEKDFQPFPFSLPFASHRAPYPARTPIAISPSSPFGSKMELSDPEKRASPG
jgi:hypothetical protein